MPNPAELFIVLLIVVVVFTATRLGRLGDALGALVRGPARESESDTSD